VYGLLIASVYYSLDIPSVKSTFIFLNCTQRAIQLHKLCTTAAHQKSPIPVCIVRKNNSKPTIIRPRHWQN